MDKDSAAYAEHVLDIFMEVMHETLTIQPLKEVGADITPALAQGLQFLLLHGVSSVRDIAQGLSMTYSAASQLTERLVRKGLVTRCDNERDRRLSEIRLTEEGRQLVEKIRLGRVNRMSRVLDRMNPGSRRLLVDTLEEFIGAAISDSKSALDSCTHCGRDHISECVVNEIYRAATGMPIQRT